MRDSWPPTRFSKKRTRSFGPRVALAKRTRFLASARAEFREAIRWYAGRDVDVAAGFVAAVERAPSVIQAAPERWPVKAGRIAMSSRAFRPPLRMSSGGTR